jgi:hypothetical protein
MKKTCLKGVAYVTGVVVGTDPTMVNMVLACGILIALNFVEEII